MRKILIGVVSVAGLLAVVLALAASPASAARQVVTINSATAAGAYTISWETNGGCDPGAGTSGASGSVTIRVTATNEDAAIAAASDTDGDGDTDREDLTALALTGSAGQEFVTVNDDCTYSFSAALIEDTTRSTCALGGLPDATDTDGIPDAAVTLTAAAASCAAGGLIKVVIGDASRRESSPRVLCTQEIIDAGGNTECDDSAEIGNVLESAIFSHDGVTAGAIAETGSFEVTATPVPNSHEQCQPATADASKNRAGDVEATLNVSGNTAIVGGSLVNINCRYDVEIKLPPGFTGGATGTNKRTNIEADGTDADLSVAVATRSVYLIQVVDGDSDGGYVTYRFTTAATPTDSEKRCVAGLPGALTATTAGGIVTSTTVELREGRFNINAAVNSHSTAGVAAFAMDHKAVPCFASAAVRNLPDHCSASNPTNIVSADLVNDADGNGNVLLEHVITCAEPAAAPPAEPPAEEPMDDGEDMSGDDMDDGEDMSGDDMDDGEDMNGTDDMGPPQDTPTG